MAHRATRLGQAWAGAAARAPPGPGRGQHGEPESESPEPSGLPPQPGLRAATVTVTIAIIALYCGRPSLTSRTGQPPVLSESGAAGPAGGYSDPGLPPRAGHPAGGVSASDSVLLARYYDAVY
jgi:hypothetical protein